MIIAACGTVSSVATNLKHDLPVPYTGVVSPTCFAAAQKTKTKKVGVIGTSATIHSHSYRDLLKQFDSEIEVIEQDCPLFVPLVENGFIDKDDQIVRLVIERYMNHIKEAGVDTVILGCTHYPIITEAISSVMGEGVELIDSGKETAIYAAKILKENNLLAEREEKGDCEFYVSDTPDGFENIANVFLGENVSHKVEQINIELY
jgi:glutamate racemase